MTRRNCQNNTVRILQLEDLISHCLKYIGKLEKKKLKNFRKNIIDELDNLKENNPSKYWTLLNDLSRDNKTTSSDIANITWFNYFQELNNNKLNAPNSDIKKDLKRLEEEQIFSELDFKITDKEIIEEIFSLKIRSPAAWT